MTWFLVVVFFTAGLEGPAHFEENWYPKPTPSFEVCERAGNMLLNYLETSINLQGEGFEVACINAPDYEGLAEEIRKQWTFGPASTAPIVPDKPA